MKLKHIAGLIFCVTMSCASTATALRAEEHPLIRYWREGHEKPVLWPSKLSTLKTIPSPDIIEKVKFNYKPSFEADGESHEQSFKKFMATAKPLDADDPTIKEWHYAPWYSGSFVIKSETYFFRLFRGGRGELLTPQKEKGMFEFDPTPDTKTPSVIAAASPKTLQSSAPPTNATKAASAETLLQEFKTVPYYFQQFEVGKKLVALNDKSVLPEMEKLLQAEDRNVRMNAGYVLAKLGDERGFLAVLSEGFA